MANNKQHSVAAIVFEKVIARVTYNYDFAPVTREDGSEDETYKSVQYGGTPSSNGIKKAVLEAEFPVAFEQKLVNEYNAAVLGLLPEGDAEKAVAKYRAFLSRRAELFAQVEADCKAEGVL